MAENGKPEADDQQRTAALESLDRLVGEWAVSGSDDTRGTVRFEWFHGERGFLVQNVDLADTRGTEYIGWDPERQAPSRVRCEPGHGPPRTTSSSPATSRPHSPRTTGSRGCVSGQTSLWRQRGSQSHAS